MTRGVTVHRLKAWPYVFQATWEGIKTYEYRENDRDFKLGDLVILEEFDPTREVYLDRAMEGKITFISVGPEWGIPIGFVCFSFNPYFRRTGVKHG